jgi:predicted RNA-binding Zn-ribbon protein involved in translation (DUF1610 family)
MSDDTKKYLSIGLAVVCIGVAGTIFYRTIGGGGARTDGNRDVALLCTHCGGFEIPVDEFRELMSQQGSGTMMMPDQMAAMPCPKCSQKTCYMAQKCKQCEAIFVFGQAKDQNYPDRCPKCGFSAIEVRQKNR